MIITETEELIIKSCDICSKEGSIPKVDSMTTIGNIDRALCIEHREEFKEWIRTKYLDTLKYDCQCELITEFVQEIKKEL